MAFIAHISVLLHTYYHHQYAYFCNLPLLMTLKAPVSYITPISQVLPLGLVRKFSREFKCYLMI